MSKLTLNSELLKGQVSEISPRKPSAKPILQTFVIQSEIKTRFS